MIALLTAVGVDSRLGKQRLYTLYVIGYRINAHLAVGVRRGELCDCLKGMLDLAACLCQQNTAHESAKSASYYYNVVLHT